MAVDPDTPPRLAKIDMAPTPWIWGQDAEYPVWPTMLVQEANRAPV